MTKVIQEFFMYNLIENCFMVLMFGILAKKTFKITDAVIYTFILAVINIFIKLILPYPIVLQVINVLCIALFFTIVYRDNKFLKYTKYVFIIMFGIMLGSEMVMTFLYTLVFNIHIENMPDMATRWVYFLPVYIIDYVIYFGILAVRKVRTHEVLGRSN